MIRDLDVRDPLADAGKLVRRMQSELRSGGLSAERADLMLQRVLDAVQQATGEQPLSFRPSELPAGTVVRFVDRRFAVIEGGRAGPEGAA